MINIKDMPSSEQLDSSTLKTTEGGKRRYSKNVKKLVDGAELINRERVVLEIMKWPY